MKYALLIYDEEGAWGSLPPEERASRYKEYDAFGNGLIEKNQMRGGEELQPTSTATTVRMRDGKVLTTDGPYADTSGTGVSSMPKMDGPFTETKEQLGGFFLIECATLDEALEAAAQVPSLKYGGTVEVRPVMQQGDHDDH